MYESTLLYLVSHIANPGKYPQIASCFLFPVSCLLDHLQNQIIQITSIGECSNHAYLSTISIPQLPLLVPSYYWSYGFQIIVNKLYLNCEFLSLLQNCGIELLLFPIPQVLDFHYMSHRYIKYNRILLSYYFSLLIFNYLVLPSPLQSVRP